MTSPRFRSIKMDKVVLKQTIVPQSSDFGLIRYRIRSNTVIDETRLYCGVGDSIQPPLKVLCRPVWHPIPERSDAALASNMI
eukprot:1172725-Rhodomonas_salina.1